MVTCTTPPFRAAVRLNSGVRALTDDMAFLKITATPEGEAPEWVRKCWVGLELPLIDGTEEAQELETTGVLSGARTDIGQFLQGIFDEPEIVSGYVVESLVAIEILASSSPEAANWWRVHVPDSVVSGETFIFDGDAGHVVPGSAP